MKPPVLVLAALALLGALVLCAQRWGYQAGRLDCGVQLAKSEAELDVLRQDGVRRATGAKQAIAAAQAGQAGAQAEAARILALRHDGDACQAAEKLIASEMP